VTVGAPNLVLIETTRERNQVEVAALYVRADGPYQGMAGVDAWDIDRDATTFAGCGPVVAHPPCGAWGRYAHVYGGDDKHCGPIAVRQVRAWGGVLEHPADTKLWTHCGLPKPGEPADLAGGWTLAADQGWWGHAAPKATWLYLVGIRPDLVPLAATECQWWRTPLGRCERMSKRQRELSPPAFARFLVALARTAAPGQALQW